MWLILMSTESVHDVVRILLLAFIVVAFDLTFVASWALSLATRHKSFRDDFVVLRTPTEKSL